MSFFTNLIYEQGLFAMFIIIFFEYACFPISSEIVLPFSGAVASIQHISFFVILPLSILAGLLGTGFCYMVGRFGGGAFINSITKRFPKTKKGIQSATDKFDRHGTLAVCIARVIPLCRTYIALIAGAAKQNPITYFVASFIGITVWNTILIGLGYVLRENYHSVEAYYNQYKHILVPILLVLTLFIIIKLFIKKLKKYSSK